MSSTVVFPGQGSQFVGMGKDVFNDFPELVTAASEVLGYSIKELCLHDPNKLINRTEYTQPSVYVVNALKYQQYIDQHGTSPDFVAGHSLGEYSALYAAGAFDFLTGLKLVAERARLMGKAQGGGMLAIVGIPAERVKSLLRDSSITTLEIANYNSPREVVLSGPSKDISRFAEVATKGGAQMAVPLRVSGAFHSRYMQNAADEFAKFVNMHSFKGLVIPSVANATADFYEKGHVADILVRQLTSPVLWVDTIRRLMAFPDMEFLEIGAGGILTKLISYIRSESQPCDHLLLKVARQSKSETAIRQMQETPRLQPEALGSEAFRRDHGVRYAYAAGSMYKGISSETLVVKMAKAGLLAYFGTGGLSLTNIEAGVVRIQSLMGGVGAYGVNLLATPTDSRVEDNIVDIILKLGVQRVEASAYLRITPALVKYRVKGLKEENGVVIAGNKVMAKVSHPEVARIFMSPPPKDIVEKLVVQGEITRSQADLAAHVPMAEDICVEADSGGHTDQGVSLVLVPVILLLRDEMIRQYGYRHAIRVGAAGGIGTPHSAAAAFVLGADFILTGSINQCTVEAGTSDFVKSMLQEMEAQDTTIAPSGDMFETGANIQVLKKGILFPFRARKLYELYQRYDSIDDIDPLTKLQIEQKYFKRTFDDVFEETKEYYAKNRPEEIQKALVNPKHKMALIFKWYFIHSNRLARHGQGNDKVDFQVHTGPALGAFNRWVKGTDLENWRHRHVDIVANHLMQATAELMESRMQGYGYKLESGVQG